MSAPIPSVNAIAIALQPPGEIAVSVEALLQGHAQLKRELADSRAFWEASLRDALRDKQQVIDGLQHELDTRWDAATQAHYVDMEADLGRTRVVAANMAAALEGVLNAALHPDVAIRAVLVPLDPVREALVQYRRFCGTPRSAV